MEDKAWPVTVIPSDEHERKQATGLLFQRMGWAGKKIPPSQQADINRQLDFWYDAEYCTRALLTCLNFEPDGTAQSRWREKSESLPEYLRSRMGKWYSEDQGDDFSTALAPPFPGLRLEQWRVNKSRQAVNDGVYRRRRSRGVRGEQARDEIAALAASRRKNPIERMREREERNAAAMDSLALAHPAPIPDIDLRAAAEMTTPRMVAAHAGHRSVQAQHPNVKAILDRLKAERRKPTPAEMAVLRSTVRDGQNRAAVGELEAAAAEFAEVAGILSTDGSRMLAFLDRATFVGTSLEAQVRLLMFAVDEAFEPGSGNPPDHTTPQL